MFTGIVEELGRVSDLSERPGATWMQVEAQVAHEQTQIGDSIAVNGVCLTVVDIDGPRLAFEAVPETLRRSNLGRLEVGSRVNLERAVRGHRPYGGHYVQGHIDSIVEVVQREPEGEAVNLTFRMEPAYARYVVPKGYVAIDGTSLTVVAVEGDTFSVTLVPHTQTAVVFGQAEPGYVANFEVDVMAKYVERLVDTRLADLEARLHQLEQR